MATTIGSDKTLPLGIIGCSLGVCRNEGDLTLGCLGT